MYRLNKIFKNFQITYYILPVCLCFGKICIDVAANEDMNASLSEEMTIQK